MTEMLGIPAKYFVQEWGKNIAEKALAVFDR